MKKKCDNYKCISPYQDKRYGKKIRVHNKMDSGRQGEGWRCTVCGDEKFKLGN